MRRTTLFTRLAATIAFLSAIPSLALAQTVETVTTTRLRIVSADDQPVLHANVTIEGGEARITDEKGEVSLGHGTRQTFIVAVRRIGYTPWFGKVNFADTSSVFTIRLKSLSQTLATVNVSARTIKSPLELTGFYDRWMMRQKGVLSAVFIGPEELEFRHPDKISGMLHGLNGVEVRRTERGDAVVWSTITRCKMAIVIDGQEQQPEEIVSTSKGGMASVKGTASAVLLDQMLDANDVMAIEIYERSGNMPISMQTHNACGAIALWTGSRKP
jgi:hypothetical protein